MLIIIAVVLAVVVVGLALLAWFNRGADGITTISSPTAAWRHDDVGSRLTIGNEQYVVVHVVSAYVVQVMRLV